MFFAITLLIGVTVGCRREKKWRTDIKKVLGVTENSASLQVYYEVLGPETTIYTGLIFGENPVPTVNDDMHYEYTIFSSTDEVVNLEELHANTNYYARSFIEVKEGKRYSEVVNFKTLPLGSPDCALTANSVSFNFGNYTAGGLVLTAYDNGFSLNAEINGDKTITFTFQGEIKSGIYSTDSSPSSGRVRVRGRLPSPYGCAFEANGGQEVYVNKNDDGTYRVEFCELKLFLKAPVGGCPETGNTISGNLNG